MKYVLLFFLITTSSLLFGIDVYIANLNIYVDSPDITLDEGDREITKNIYSSLKDESFEGFLFIKRTSDFSRYKNTVVFSSLDASEICEQLNITYLVFGSIKKTDTYYDAALNIFDNAQKEIKKTIYAKTGEDELPLLIDILTKQVSDYLKSLLGIEAKEDTTESHFTGFYFETGAGYFIPLPEWGNTIYGIADVYIGSFFVPELLPKDAWKNIYFRLGTQLEWSLGINKPGFEEGFLHTITLSTPILVFTELIPHHVLCTGLIPSYRFDILFQNPIFNDSRINVSTAFGLGVPVKYEYWFGKNRDWSLGLSAQFDMYFYKTLLMEISTEISWSFRLGGAE